MKTESQLAAYRANRWLRRIGEKTWFTKRRLRNDRRNTIAAESRRRNRGA